MLNRTIYFFTLSRQLKGGLPGDMLHSFLFPACLSTPPSCLSLSEAETKCFHLLVMKHLTILI